MTNDFSLYPSRISSLYHCNIHYEHVVKHSNVGHKFSYVLLTLSPCVLIQKYLHVAGFGVLASTAALTSTFWHHLTSLQHTKVANDRHYDVLADANNSVDILRTFAAESNHRTEKYGCFTFQ